MQNLSICYCSHLLVYQLSLEKNENSVWPLHWLLPHWLRVRGTSVEHTWTLQSLWACWLATRSVLSDVCAASWLKCFGHWLQVVNKSLGKQSKQSSLFFHFHLTGQLLCSRKDFLCIEKTVFLHFTPFVVDNYLLQLNNAMLPMVLCVLGVTDKRQRDDDVKTLLRWLLACQWDSGSLQQ